MLLPFQNEIQKRFHPPKMATNPKIGIFPNIRNIYILSRNSNTVESCSVDVEWINDFTNKHLSILIILNELNWKLPYYKRITIDS